MTVISLAVETTKFLFGMCDRTVDSDVDTGDFSLVPGILHLYGHVRMQSHVYQGMDCIRIHVTRNFFFIDGKQTLSLSLGNLIALT